MHRTSEPDPELADSAHHMRRKALATNVLVGMHPVLTQVPPNAPRSMIATVIPAAASRRASGGPACPVPMTIAS
jgi:hypothetical protein